MDRHLPKEGVSVRAIDVDAMREHTNRRFRSESDYAWFEYYRSPKIIQFVERAGGAIDGRILDAGCGAGGMALSLAEEVRAVVGIDPMETRILTGRRLAASHGRSNLHLIRADGQSLPFGGGSFDGVISHAVIEHVPDAPAYLRECARVVRAGGWVYLSTAPYLSFAGAHLPRLRIPLPLHLVLPRSVVFGLFCGLARHAPWALREPAHENSFIVAAQQHQKKGDDLLERVGVRRLRKQIRDAGLRIVREELRVTKTFARGDRISAWLRETPIVQDVVVGNMEYLLIREPG